MAVGYVFNLWPISRITRQIQPTRQRRARLKLGVSDTIQDLLSIVTAENDHERKMQNVQTGVEVEEAVHGGTVIEQNGTRSDSY